MRAGAVVAVGAAARPAAAQPISALSELAQATSDNSPAHINGHGWFESTDARGEVDGITRIAGPDGMQWQRVDFNGTLRPHWFEHPEDGPDAALMIQRALDHSARFGPFAVDLGSDRYRCETPLTLDPTRVALRGIDAVLDFSARPEPAVQNPSLTLADIVPEGGWTQNGGALSGTESSEVLSHFLPLPENGRYRVSFTIGALSGTSDFPALTVALSGAQRTPLAAITAIGPGQYTFEIDGPQPAARLSFDADADVRIDALTITAQGRRECVLVQAGVESPQYGHKWIEGIDIAGPGIGTSLHGIRFETATEAKSSRATLRHVTVRGFHTGLVFSHRAYLIHAVGLRVACDIGLHFLGGTQDAGELITLTDSVIDGGRIGLRNNGGEFVLTGTAIDFVDQVFVGAGQLTLQGCHLEVNRPKAADAPLFDLAQGNIAILGGSFGVTGSNFDAGNQCDHIFELRSRAATATMNDVTIYNLRSQSGALAGGPGWLDVARVRGRRPRHMAPIVQFGASRNLLGPLPLDLRTSTAADGPFERFPTQVTAFKVSPAFRFIWIFGHAPAGVELGAAFDIRADNAGLIKATLQAFDGDTRVTIGDIWPVDVGDEWQRYLDNTADTHPASPLNGRMPAGYSEVALMLDLSMIDGTVEIADPFVCAV